MRIKVHDTHSEIPLERSQWNALAGQGPTRTVFQTHEWASAWWSTFGHRHRLLHLDFETLDNVPAGFACLMTSAADGDGDRWHILADANSDYCDIPIGGNRFAGLEALVKFFARDFVGWETLSLMNIPEQSVTLAALTTLCARHGLWLHSSRRITAPKLRFAADGGDVEIKYSVRRHHNRLERLGELEFRVLREARELPRLLGVLFEQHVARYRLKGERSLFEDVLFRRFYERLAFEMLEAGWLHFSELCLDGKPIAVHFGFEYRNILTWYKPAFDVAYQRYSPGTVLIKHLIDDAKTRHLDELDFTIGDEAFKARFSNVVSYNRNVVIYKRRPSAYLHALREHTMSVGKRIVALSGKVHVPSQRRHPHP